MREQIEKILEDTIAKHDVAVKTDQGQMDALTLIHSALTIAQMYNQYVAGKLEVQKIVAERSAKKSK